MIQTILLDPVTGKIVATVLGLLAVIIAIRSINASMNRYIKDSSTRYRAKKIILFIGYFLAMIVLVLVFHNHLKNLTIVFGVAGAGIAFASQELIASIAGWFAISLNNFYTIGDRIELDGIKGDVIDIGILRTTLMEVGKWVNADLYSGRVVRIANSFVFKEPVFNYSGDFPFLWDEITVPVKYGSDYHLSRELFQKIAGEVVGDYVTEAKKSWQGITQKFMIENAKIDPAVTMIANDNWIEFTIRYVVDYKVRRSTKDILFTRILEEIGKTNGQVSLASATFQIVGLPDLNVKVGAK